MLVALFLSLASCGGGSSFDPVDGTAKNPGKTVPPVLLQQVTGIPPGKLPQLASALAAAAGQRDIGIVEGDLQSGSFTLTGNFQAQAGSAGVRVIYQWQLRDADGVLIHTVNGDENAGLFTGSDAWAAVNAAVLDRISRSTAESLAVRLAQLGYATRLVRLDMPPPEYFAMAGPGAEREIDFETLTGSVSSMVAMDGLGPEADVTDRGPEPQTAVAGAEHQAAPEAKAAEAAFARENADGKVEIKAVAVLAVKGSPGGGNAELTAAMRRTLAAAGWPVISKPRPDALTIRGRVDLSKPKGNQQDVSVRWVVETPAGSELGDVKQANSVPAGMLDTGWGEAAFAVAEAAASGIFDIIKVYR